PPPQPTPALYPNVAIPPHWARNLGPQPYQGGAVRCNHWGIGRCARALPSRATPPPGLSPAPTPGGPPSTLGPPHAGHARINKNTEKPKPYPQNRGLGSLRSPPIPPRTARTTFPQVHDYKPGSAAFVTH